MKLARQGRKKKFQTVDEDEKEGIHHDNYCIDGKIFYMKRSEMQQKATEIVERTIDKNVSIDHMCPTAETSFRQWASEHEQRKKSVKDVVLTAVKENFDNQSDDSSRKSMNINQTFMRAKHRRRHKNTLNHLSGYMYGKFTKTKLKRTDHSDRFGIPYSMIDRAAAKTQKQQIQENVLRKVRLSHMGYYQPPSKDDSSDNESTQNVKRLALLRTPYFLIPTIKISRVRRKERFRNKYLRKERLNRINLLLYEHDKKSENQTSKINRHIKDLKLDKLKIREAVDREKCRRLNDEQNRLLAENPIKKKYRAIVREQYEKQQRICEPSVSGHFSNPR